MADKGDMVPDRAEMWPLCWTLEAWLLCIVCVVDIVPTPDIIGLTRVRVGVSATLLSEFAEMQTKNLILQKSRNLV